MAQALLRKPHPIPRIHIYSYDRSVAISHENALKCFGGMWRQCGCTWWYQVFLFLLPLDHLRFPASLALILVLAGEADAMDRRRARMKRLLNSFYNESARTHVSSRPTASPLPSVLL